MEIKQGISKWGLRVAVKVVAITNSKQITVSLEEPDAVLHPAILSSAALQASVDDVRHSAVAWKPPGGDIGGGGSPLRGDDVVGGRLGGLRGHPEPDGGLEGDDGVGGDEIRVVDQIHSNCISALTVVVVPGYLDRTPAIVLLARSAGELGGWGAVGAWVLLSHEAVTPCVWSVRCRGPSPGCFVRRLPQEGRDLSLSSGCVSGVAEAGESPGGGDEGIVGVEASGWAGSVVAMFEHLVEGGPGYQSAEIRRSRLSPALALATLAAVVVGGAAPPELTATETPWTQRTPRLASTLLSPASSH